VRRSPSSPETLGDLGPRTIPLANIGIFPAWCGGTASRL